MRKIFLTTFGLVFTLVGCSSFDPKSDVKDESAEIVHKQIGRFAAIPVPENVPPLILDTATGCVKSVDRAENGSISIDEVSLVGGGSSCYAMKYLRVIDNDIRVKK